jgi:hypothetical protein
MEEKGGKKLFVKSIFCPNLNYFNTSYNSLSNNLNYFLMLNLKIDVLIIGWIPEILRESREKIEILIELLKKNINIKFIPWNKNYGKIKLFYEFNHFFEHYDYIFYADHDILFDITKTKLNLLLMKMQNIFEKHNFSILTFNQLEDCRHQSCLIDNIENYDDIKIATSELNSDIGGGAFILKKTIMQEPKYYYVYGFDEKYLNSCISGKNGVILDFYVIHPYNKDDININKDINYKKWKIMQIVENLGNYEKYTYEEYLLQIENCETFWITK